MGDVGIASTVTETKFGEGMFGDLLGRMVNIKCASTNMQKTHKIAKQNRNGRLLLAQPRKDGSCEPRT